MRILFVLGFTAFMAACNIPGADDDDSGGNNGPSDDLHCEDLVAVQADCDFYYLETVPGWFDSVSGCEDYYHDDPDEHGPWLTDCGGCLADHQDESCSDIDEACLCDCCSTCSSDCD